MPILKFVFACILLIASVFAASALSQESTSKKSADSANRQFLEKGTEFLEKGIELSEQGKYFAAIENYVKALKLDPQNSLIYYNRGVALANLNRYEAAIADFTMAIKLNPSFVEAYKNRGLVQTQSNRHLEKAVADYDMAIQLAPKDPASYLGKALALSRLDKNAAAIIALDQATELNPELAIAYFVKASIYIDLNEQELAISNYEKAANLYQAQNNESGYKNSLEAISEIRFK